MVTEKHNDIGNGPKKPHIGTAAYWIFSLFNTEKNKILVHTVYIQ